MEVVTTQTSTTSEPKLRAWRILRGETLLLLALCSKTSALLCPWVLAQAVVKKYVASVISAGSMQVMPSEIRLVLCASPDDWQPLR